MDTALPGSHPRSPVTSSSGVVCGGWGQRHPLGAQGRKADQQRLGGCCPRSCSHGSLSIMKENVSLGGFIKFTCREDRGKDMPTTERIKVIRQVVGLTTESSGERSNRIMLIHSFQNIKALIQCLHQPPLWSRCRSAYALQPEQSFLNVSMMYVKHISGLPSFLGEKQKPLKSPTGSWCSNSCLPF